MHYRVPKPCFRKSRKTWYVQIDGRQIGLGKDRTDAFQRYYEVMANPPEDHLEKATVTDGRPLIQIFDRFHDWVKKHRFEATYGWYPSRLAGLETERPAPERLLVRGQVAKWRAVIHDRDPIDGEQET